MFRSTEIDKLIEDYGKNGVRLLVLFRLLKSRVTYELRKRSPTVTLNEAILNQLCVAKAYELLRLGPDEPEEKDIKELLSKLNAPALKGHKRQPTRAF